jgi:formylglycine-generating enzyme required for sulfatase activity
MTQTARRATFLLRHPRMTLGFREKLTDGRSDDEERVYEKGVFTEGAFEAGNGDATDTDQALTMLWIPPGRFWMGSPEDELKRSGNEGPQHLVQLPGFFLSQTPITQAQWRVVATWLPREGETWGGDLKADPSRFQGGEARLLEGENSTDQRPVEKVNWHDAMEFCSRLSQRTGRTYTLPSEAQWEYACRSGTTTPFHFGETITTVLANYNGQSTYGDGPKGENRQQTTPMGSFPANALGLQDMHGNVWEWCLDAWHVNYEGAPGDGSAWLDEEAEEDAWRLLRGGSWNNGPRYCRAAYRYHLDPGDDFSFVGFRVVCLPQGPAS